MREDSTPRSRPAGGLAQLWTGTSPSRAARTGLNTGRIVAAAIDLADEEGLESVSMSRVADRLGFTTMAVYRHLASKDDLLLAMHDTAWQPRTPREAWPDDGVGDWRERLTRWCHEQYAILRRHPWLERIRHGERAGTPSQLEWMERGLRALTGTGLGERVKLDVLLLLNGYVFWEGRTASDIAAVAGREGIAAEAAAGAFQELIRQFADAERFPALFRALAGGGIAPDGGLRDGAFADGLRFLLDGVARLVADADAHPDADGHPDGPAAQPV